jgi:hypothetical protein
LGGILHCGFFLGGDFSRYVCFIQFRLRMSRHDERGRQLMMITNRTGVK